MVSLNDPSCLSELSNNLDNILINAVDNTNAQSFAPGVVLGVTNEKETKYLNSKGVVSLDNRKEMTTDAVFATIRVQRPSQPQQFSNWLKKD